MAYERDSFTNSIHLALYSYLSLLGCQNSLVMLQNEMDAIYSSIKPEEQREITKIFVQDIMHCKSKEFYKRKLLLKEDKKETKKSKKRK